MYTHAMNEAQPLVNEFKLVSGTINLTYTASTPGEYTFTITDTTDSNDRSRVVPNLTFTVYVVNLDEEVRTNNSLGFEFSDGTIMTPKLRAVDRSSQIPQDISFGVGVGVEDIPLVFTVEGGGQVYARETGRATDGNLEGPRSSGTREHVLSSAAEVYLDMKGRTNTVTVYPRGTNPNVTGRSIIYVNRYANLTITHGNTQTGAPGGRLEEYLGVQVTDSGGNRIPGMVVRFPATNTDTNGVFIPVPGTTVYVDTDNELVNASADGIKEFIAEASKMLMVLKR